MQVRYVNKALQSFDSTQVIPIQFVLFTLSVIIGSAVLYRDFERTSAEQAAKFVGGCLLTFFGVFLITSGRHRRDDDSELPDDEDVEETIGLREQEGSDPYPTAADHGRKNSIQALSESRSRRSSHASFSHGAKPSLSQPPASTSRSRRLDPPLSLSMPGAAESSPLLHSLDDEHIHPGLPPTVSGASIPTINTVASEPVQSATDLGPHIIPPPSPTQQLAPRASATNLRPHSRHYSNNFISPSPLSSTVSAVVADSLRRNEDPHTTRRRLLRRRPTLRSSLFVPQDDNDRSGSSDPLLVSSTDGEQIPNDDEESQEDSDRQARSRSHSISNTFKEFFSGRVKRSRVNSNPEGGEPPEHPANDRPDHG
jgi:magnesium transporter